MDKPERLIKLKEIFLAVRAKCSYGEQRSEISKPLIYKIEDYRAPEKRPA